MPSRHNDTVSRRTRSQRSSAPAKPALPAKLARPAASGLVLRERLFQRLDQSLQGKVVWITGPGGAGKTSLVSTYLETRALEHIWYQVDASDADLASFTQYLRLAVSDRPGAPLPAFTAADYVAIEAFARRFFEAFFDRFANRCVIVFDNYQEVAADSRFHDLVAALLDHLSEHVRVVVLSRAEPPAALVKSSLDPAFTIIDWREVQFSDAETAALARSWGIEGAEAVSALHDVSRGWAAGMVLMMRAAQRGVDLARAHWEPPRQLFDYFASQVWSRIPATTQSFLFRTAFLPHMTVALAEMLTGDPRAARILANLHGDNFFTDRRPGVESVYEYHPLFREFLVARATEALDPEALGILRRNAGALLEKSGEVAAAAEILTAARDWVGVRSLVERQAERMVDQAAFHTLRTWLDALPAEDLADAPWLLLWLGVCKAVARDPTFRASLERSCELFDAAGDLVGSCAARGWLLQTASSAAEIEDLLNGAQEQFERHGWIEDPRVEARIIRNFNADLRFPARHPLLIGLVDRADHLAHQAPEPGQRLRMASFAGLWYAYLGDVAKLRSEIAAVEADLAAPGASVRDRYLFVCGTQANEAFFSGTFDAAHEAAATLEAEGSNNALDEMGPMLLGLRHSLVSGDVDAVRKWDERVNQTPYFVSRMRAVQLQHSAAARLACGDLAGAWSKACAACSLMTPRSVGFAMSLSTKAMVLLARGENEDARATLEHAVAVARELNGPVVLFPALQLLAMAKSRLGRIDEALAHLREGMRLARETRCITGRPSLSIELFRELAEFALANSVEVEHAKEIVVALKLRPRSPELDTWPWPVRIRALGTFGVERAGSDTGAESFSGKKKPKKPFELLQYLIAHGGASVSATAVIDALWPDAAGDAGKRSLDVTLYRLRRLLGSEEAIKVEGAKLSLNNSMCWVDCFAFERLATKLAELNGASTERRFEELASRALDLYRGHFLANEDAHSWASAYREKLRSQFMRVVERAGDHLELTTRPAGAEQLYRKALQLDPIAEAIYRRLMRSLASRGEKAEAIHTYRRCREMLSIVLNVKPAPETARLYESIRTG